MPKWSRREKNAKGFRARLSERAQRCQNCIHWKQDDLVETAKLIKGMADVLPQVRRLPNGSHAPTPHKAFPGGSQPRLDLIHGYIAAGVLGRCQFTSPPPEFPPHKRWGTYTHSMFVCSRWSGRVRPDESGPGATELPGEADERLNRFPELPAAGLFGAAKVLDVRGAEQAGDAAGAPQETPAPLAGNGIPSPRDPDLLGRAVPVTPDMPLRLRVVDADGNPLPTPVPADPKLP